MEATTMECKKAEALFGEHVEATFTFELFGRKCASKIEFNSEQDALHFKEEIDDFLKNAEEIKGGKT